MSREEYEEFANFMIEWDSQAINRRAVRELIERHREEYEELSGIAAAQQIEKLQRDITRAASTIEKLRAANPDGIAVPALTETANALVARVDELEGQLKQQQRLQDDLTRENRKLRELVAKEE